MLNLMIEHARELVQAHPEWDGYDFEAIGHSDDGSGAKLIRITGAVAPKKMRGKNKGERNWKLRDRATERTAYFTPDEHAAWVKAWQERTGLCHVCAGEGEMLENWSAANGVTMKPCSTCAGTGKAHNADAGGDGD